MTTRKKNCTVYHQQGVDAAWNEETYSDCPHTEEGYKRNLWFDGFKLALSCLRRCVSNPEKKDD